ncbi:MAG TPA: AbrB/MazE/SpoVT family DNA-binding domain-containing protein [Methylothermaceae bacterium]|nr:AbrB/MazE/SpoVT family DNA-binding domain-containing protein [Methylothermaceae bacterium]
MHKLKIIPVGDTVGIELPEELLMNLGLKRGDILYLTATSDGFFLSPINKDSQMENARLVMKKRGAALRDLTK